MAIYVLMQHYESSGQSITVPLKAFSNHQEAKINLLNKNLNLELVKGLRLAYQKLLEDWLRRNDENLDYNEALEKEKNRLIQILELDKYLEEHGILLEDELPNYYLVDVEFDNR